MNRKMLALVSASAFLAAGLVPLSAMAADQEVATMKVAVGDLNVGSTHGAKVALRRVEAASGRFCGVPAGPSSLSEKMAAQKCQARMTYLAVNKLGSPIVTAMYEKSSSGPAILLASR